jgi:hypothetical protein
MTTTSTSRPESVDITSDATPVIEAAPTSTTSSHTSSGPAVPRQRTLLTEDVTVFTAPAPKRSVVTTHLKRGALGLAAAAVVVLGSLAGGQVVADLLTPDAAAQTAPTDQAQKAKTGTTAEPTGLEAMRATPEPTTVRGYQRMFDQVSVNEWGGADVSISDRLPDGRIVWLYGDTLSADNGFVNSTAIVQDGGNLHVSRGGAQVLPGEPKVDGRKRIYWIETMKVIGKNRISVTAMPMSIGTSSVWDFQRWRAESRQATLRVTPAGDVIFEKWTGWVTAPVLPDEFIILGPNHFTYQPVIHEHIRLESGQYLKTVSQNWDDDFEDHVGPDGKMQFKDWRPIFSQVPYAQHPDAL